MVTIILSMFFSIQSSAAERVISLSPAITEIIFAMGLENKLVGTSEFSDFPLPAKEITRVGPYSKPNMEKIISLHPDLILIPTEGSEDAQEKLKRQNRPNQVLKMQSLDEIPKAAVIISERLGSPEKGQKFASDWRAAISKSFNHKSYRSLPTLIIIQSDPVISVGSGTFLDELVQRCGGDNVYHSLSGYPKVSRESVLNKNFKLILVVEHFNSTILKEQTLSEWKSKHKKAAIEFVDPDIATRPGPRLLLGIDRICKIIQRLDHES